MCAALVGERSVLPFECAQLRLHNPLPVCGLCLLKTTVNLNVLDPESMKPFHTWAVVCFSLTFG